MPTRDKTRLERHREFDWNTGVNVRYLRILNDMEQKTLAEIADMDISQLSRAENGLRSFKFKEAMTIAKVFGVRPERLIREVISTNDSSQME
ncbi:MAG TPA: helix-turn-helix transcriptional regulator [Nitrospiraceae bacterium]|nr:helix-turn-helix transcriptional regulator [Nitrospiraceae bacterium]